MKKEKTLIIEYQKSWAKDFSTLKNILEENISLKNIKIEHIGSTSVKGLAAKAIIDIDIVYNEFESFKTIKSDLERIGYYHNGNQGIHGREVFKRLRPNNIEFQILDITTHHLYVCHKESEELKRHLIFRDFLRANPPERMAYQKLKYAIAEQTNNDKKEYQRIKEIRAKQFVESIIKQHRFVIKNKFS